MNYYMTVDAQDCFIPTMLTIEQSNCALVKTLLSYILFNLIYLPFITSHSYT